jgi:hypothetical protein
VWLVVGVSGIAIGSAVGVGAAPVTLSIGAGNVASLQAAFFAPPAADEDVSGVREFDSRFYAVTSRWVESRSTHAGRLEVYDANGVSHCGGSPLSCRPLWTAPLGRNPDVLNLPGAAGHLVYVTTNVLRAFDVRAPATHCKGAPAACTPVWYASLGRAPAQASRPVMFNGLVYVAATQISGVSSTRGDVFAFDAAGRLQFDFVTGAFPSAPAIASGRLYVTTTVGQLDVFDVSGKSGCSTAHVCHPLWVGRIAAAGNSLFAEALPPPVPATNGSVYLVDGHLKAFDAAGRTGCTGTPRTCNPTWVSANMAWDTPAVADEVVQVGGYGNARTVFAYDAQGVNNCSGTPRTCTAIRQADITGTTYNAVFGDPKVNNGVLYVPTFEGIQAFDARGVAACTGTPPDCAPLWVSPPLEHPVGAGTGEEYPITVGVGATKVWANDPGAIDVWRLP